LWATHLTIGPGDLTIDESLLHWVNDGLMAIFFLVVGLEIKREVLVGELASPRQAGLPVAAAIGGAAVPALLYLAVNAGTAGSDGWGVPMATDIAFALGILALVGERAPIGLRIFLTALAIVDDLVAVLIIAVFYTGEIAWPALGVGGAILAGLVGLNLLHVRSPIAYAVLGSGLWIAFLQSGVHATLAGVLVALTIPARTRLDAVEFRERGRALLAEFEQAAAPPDPEMTSTQQAVVQELEATCEGVQTPLQRLEHALHPWVAFVIMPLFALANAGVVLDQDLGAALSNRVTVGIVVGLIIGKQAGILLAAWLAIRTNIASLPSGVAWRHLYGASWLAGIGFTMSLFITELAFTDEASIASAKIGILIASIVAGVAGWFLLRRSAPTAA